MFLTRTHTRTCTCTRTAGHFCMSVLKPGLFLNLAPQSLFFVMFQLPTCCESRGAPAPQCGRSSFCRGMRTERLAVMLLGFLIGLVCFVWMHQCVPKQDGLATYSVRPQASSQVFSLCADQIEWMLAFYYWCCILFSVARAAEQFCFFFI